MTKEINLKKDSSIAEKLGTFFIVFITLSGAVTFMLIAIGVNPTLVLSVVGAPIWIVYVLLARWITRLIT
jgi:Flp pilus assembly protein TadB|tara:strand:+ start:300 stop:509 length:210 start_codon:yes stop_codon:yes gene_type:complete